MSRSTGCTRATAKALLEVNICALFGARTDDVQDVVVENCSCIFDTSAIHGGRMSRDDYRDIGGRKCPEHIFEDTTARMQEVERSRKPEPRSPKRRPTRRASGFLLKTLFINVLGNSRYSRNLFL